jgi:hypothetical protein
MSRDMTEGQDPRSFGRKVGGNVPRGGILGGCRPSFSSGASGAWSEVPVVVDQTNRARVRRAFALALSARRVARSACFWALAI